MKSFVESKLFEAVIVVVIALNAITLGFETYTGLPDDYRFWIHRLDQVFLFIFVIELMLKGIVYRHRFFSDPWRIFDLIVVGIALIPSSGPLSILRALRILRTLRMISVVPSLKRVVNGLLTAIPGLGAVSIVMVLIFYVSAVIATKVFGADFPEWFGSIWASGYSLFQIMTLESWSMGIVRPVMKEFPYSWMFFLPFILLTTFTMLNLFIAVIVNAMQAETDQAAEERSEQSYRERKEILSELKKIRMQIEKNNSR